MSAAMFSPKPLKPSPGPANPAVNAPVAPPTRADLKASLKLPPCAKVAIPDPIAPE